MVNLNSFWNYVFSEEDIIIDLFVWSRYVYCDNIKEQATVEQKKAIIAIKKELISRNLYSFEKYKSIDVYEAVLEHHVKDAREFLALYEV